jgi:glycine oxidase
MKDNILILGGGITAFSTAWYIQKAGFSVQVVFQRRSGTATRAAGGMLSPSCEADGCSKELIQLGVNSCRMYPEWIREIEETSGLSCGYRETGTLLAAMHHDHFRDLEHLAKFQERHGLKAIEVSRKEVRELEPNLTRQVGGLLCPDDHSVNPRQLYPALFKALLRKGVSITIAQTIDIVKDDSRVQHVIVDGKCREADSYVLSDGAWTNYIFPLPLRPVKGQFICLQGTELLKRVVRTPNVYCIPRSNGEYFLGASMEEEGFNGKNTAGAVMDFLYHAFQILPGIYELDIAETGSGFRPALRDNQPLISASPLHNCWFNTAHFRHGILIAPAAAQLLVQILKGEKQSPAFSFERFGGEHFPPPIMMTESKTNQSTGECSGCFDNPSKF